MIFIKNGANVNYQDKWGNTILMCLVSTFNKNIDNIDINVSFDDIAIQYNEYGRIELEILNYLIKNGADVNIKEKNGLIALDLLRKTYDKNMTSDELQAYNSKIKILTDAQNKAK